ncbi:putative amidoligase enzyme [compost metagenome]
MGMPRELMNRRFGIEMEGYFSSNPREVKIKGARIKKDLSLTNPHWNTGRDKFGVEINSRPIKTIGIVDRIFNDMVSLGGWSVDERAGTHIHVEIADYTELDKLKLLRFCKGIENIMYTFVKNYRYSNNYCYRLDNSWRKVFKETGNLEETIQGARNGLVHIQNVLRKKGIPTVYNPKYNWCNIYDSHHRTAEFRLFHAIENVEEAKNFVRLAIAIVDMVKVVSPEQLEFIIASIYSDSKTAQDCVDKLYEAVGLDQALYGLSMQGTEAYSELSAKMANRDTQGEKKKKGKLIAAYSSSDVDIFASGNLFA